MNVVIIEEPPLMAASVRESIAMGARDIAMRAKTELQEITGLRPDTVSKVLRDEQGWKVSVDLVEHKSIPESRDVIATYELMLDGDGNMMTYERVRRFIRGETEI